MMMNRVRYKEHESMIVVVLMMFPATVTAGYYKNTEEAVSMSYYRVLNVILGGLTWVTVYRWT
jgi:hypothetical protein